MNDLKNNLPYSVLLLIVFVCKSFENNYFIVRAFKTYIRRLKWVLNLVSYFEEGTKITNV